MKKSDQSFIEKAKKLLEWNKRKLTKDSDLTIKDLQGLFAPHFKVLVNGREYDANYHNYYEFLNKFRSDIRSIDYEVQEYIDKGRVVVMPLKATVTRVQGKRDVFDAIMLLKFNEDGKIVHWQEIYVLRA